MLLCFIFAEDRGHFWKEVSLTIHTKWTRTVERPGRVCCRLLVPSLVPGSDPGVGEGAVAMAEAKRRTRWGPERVCVSVSVCQCRSGPLARVTGELVTSSCGRESCVSFQDGRQGCGPADGYRCVPLGKGSGQPPGSLSVSHGRWVPGAERTGYLGGGSCPALSAGPSPSNPDGPYSLDGQ